MTLRLPNPFRSTTARQRLEAELVAARAEAEAWRVGMEQALAQRDAARAEIERLRAEVAGLVARRDEAVSEAAALRAKVGYAREALAE